MSNNATSTGLYGAAALCPIGSGRGALGRARVFQTRGPMFDSQLIAVVSERASDLKCYRATLVDKSVDP